MKRILPIIGIMILTSSCGLILSEEDGAEKPQDHLVTDLKVAETVAEVPQEQLFGTEQAPQSDIVIEEAKVETPVSVIEEVKVETPLAEEALVEPPKEETRAPVEPRHEEAEKKVVAEAKPTVMSPQEFGSYKVAKDETLMMVAFRIYGDYRKWKELKALNKQELKHGIHKGLMLKYQEPEQKFVWQPNGVPYLVKQGNTLGIISQDKYGTARKWKVLYENNRPLIRNPNVIFAGFTIYYVPTRGVASQKK